MTEETPVVSVITPAYNAEYSLRGCLESVLVQRIAPVEIIVIDDGSTDATAEVARSFGSRVRYLAQPNRGQGAARNLGLAQSRGKYIAFLDADDYWREPFLSRCVDFLERRPEAVAVSTGLVIRAASGKERILPSVSRAPDTWKSERVLDDFFAYWAEHDHVRTGSNVIRRWVVEEAGYQRDDLRISQDLEYWAYIGTYGRWGFIPEPLWVGDSRAYSKKAGWSKKYQGRRKLCPTVEEWQARVLPRIRKEDLAAFETVRGRVAGGYAHNKILGGDPAGALAIVQKYGRSMPRNKVVGLMRFGARFGPLAWSLSRWLIVARERLKA